MQFKFFAALSIWWNTGESKLYTIQVVSTALRILFAYVIESCFNILKVFFSVCIYNSDRVYNISMQSRRIKTKHSTDCGEFPFILEWSCWNNQCVNLCLVCFDYLTCISVHHLILTHLFLRLSIPFVIYSL